MNVIVKVVAKNEEYILKVTPTISINDIKTELSKKYHIANADIILISQGKPLPDKSTLQDNGLISTSFLIMLTKEKYVNPIPNLPSNT